MYTDTQTMAIAEKVCARRISDIAGCTVYCGGESENPDSASFCIGECVSGENVLVAPPMNHFRALLTLCSRSRETLQRQIMLILRNSTVISPPEDVFVRRLPGEILLLRVAVGEEGVGEISQVVRKSANGKRAASAFCAKFPFDLLFL